MASVAIASSLNSLNFNVGLQKKEVIVFASLILFLPFFILKNIFVCVCVFYYFYISNI